jgi:phosphoribosylanthranilate isomerase
VLAKIKFCGIMQPGEVSVAAEASGGVSRRCFCWWSEGGHNDQARRRLVVEMASGAESRPGIKDPNTIGRFVEAVFAHSSVT